MLTDRKARTRFNKRLREIGVPAKACGVCHVVRSLGQYSKHAKSVDGRRGECRDCDRAVNAAWRAANPERRREYRAENADRIRESKARWNAENADRRREYYARYYSENAERIRELNTQWRAENPGKKRAQNQRRRARKANVPHEPYNRTEIFERYGDICAYCDAPAEHLDHVHPISKGGADAPHNLLPACAPCNLSKNAKTLAEWAATF